MSVSEREGPLVRWWYRFVGCPLCLAQTARGVRQRAEIHSLDIGADQQPLGTADGHNWPIIGNHLTVLIFGLRLSERVEKGPTGGQRMNDEL